MKYFRLEEFDCRCRRGIACDAAPMQRSFLERLDRLRHEWGKPLSPTSGRRCKMRNKKEGGAPDSRHLHGDAADFNFKTAAECDEFAELAEKFGMDGIGQGKIDQGKYLVHVDTRGYRARWGY